MVEVLIVLRVEGGGQVGWGHVRRSLQLARACPLPHSVSVVTTSPLSSLPDLADCDYVQLTDPGDDVEVIRRHAARRRYRSLVVVVDHYGLAYSWEAKVHRHTGALVVALDDLPDRPHAAAVLVNAGAVDGVAPTRWQRAVLVGLRFALVDPTLASAADAVGDAVRVHVCFGASAQVDATLAVASALLHQTTHHVVIVVGPHWPESAGLDHLVAQYPQRATVHINPPSIVATLESATVCVGAAGVLAYERAAMGKPSAIATLASNQANQARQLCAAGAAVPLRDVLNADQVVSAVAVCLAHRATMAQAARRAVDGQGAHRVWSVVVEHL